jgi:hypothetical protein
MEPLEELSNWQRKPKDPCFIGTVLASRIQDIYNRFKQIAGNIENYYEIFNKLTIKVFFHITEDLGRILDAQSKNIANLTKISGYLDQIVGILDDDSQDWAIGQKCINEFCHTLKVNSGPTPFPPLVHGFIHDLCKFITTKGKLLFNYRKIPGAPTTNNFQELKFKKIKHFLRRVIGHSAAEEYLIAHAEHILFVDPEEIREVIEEILHNSDQNAIRKEVRAKRRHLDSWILALHDLARWKENLKK